MGISLDDHENSSIDPSPLIDSKVNDEGGEIEENKPASKREWIVRLATFANVAVHSITIALVSISTFGRGATTANQVVGASFSYMSSGLGLANSPVVVTRERQLTNADTFRAAMNGVLEQASLLAGQNDVLSGEIDELQEDVDRMKEVESALSSLAETQGSQLNELMELIEENKQINRELRAVLQNIILEDVIELVLDIDHDGSFIIEDNEIDRLIVGITLIDGVKSFDQAMFRDEVMRCEGKADKVIQLIKTMVTTGGCGLVLDPEARIKNA